MIWQAIEANRRRSWVLFIGMAAALAVLGYFIGYLSLGPDGAVSGLFFSGLLWMILSFVSYFFGDQILLSVSGAREITKDVHPKLFNVTEEMTLAAGLNRMPKLYVIDELAPNAFATGIHPENASITVTLGLLTRLNRDELQGVIAHEMSHILNRDVLFVTLAGTMLGAVQIFADSFFRSTFRSASSSSKRYSSRSSSGGGGAVLMVAALIVVIIAPILIRLFYFSLSRKREYLADACGARLTRYPEGLASALEKISGSGHRVKSANAVTAAMFIVNPFSEAAVGLFSTHPPAQKRIEVLRAMQGGASLANYEKAFSAVLKDSVLPQASLLRETVPLRTAPAADPIIEAVVGDQKALRMETADLMRATHHFAFYPCGCGLKIKIPPGFHEPKITCPRCGFVISKPFFGPIGKTQGGVYARRTKGWESFFCDCGRVMQISPGLQVPAVTCSTCGKETKIA